MLKILCVLLCIPTLVMAESKLDFGFNRTNNSSMSASVGVENKIDFANLKFNNTASYVYESKESKTTKDQFDLLSKQELNVNKYNYIQSSLRFERDGLRDHTNKYVLAAGHGLRVLNTNQLKVNHELSLGYQIYTPDNTFIVRSNLIAKYDLTNQLSAGNNFIVEQGSNTYIRNVSDLSINLENNLVLSLTHTYVSDINKNDNITSIRLGVTF